MPPFPEWALETVLTGVLSAVCFLGGGQYLKNRSYGTLKSCEREESGTSTVGRCGTHGGPPGLILIILSSRRVDKAPVHGMEGEPRARRSPRS